MKRSTHESKQKCKDIYNRILETKYVEHSENVETEIENAIAELNKFLSGDLTEGAKKRIAGLIYLLKRMYPGEGAYRADG